MASGKRSACTSSRRSATRSRPEVAAGLMTCQPPMPAAWRSNGSRRRNSSARAKAGAAADDLLAEQGYGPRVGPEGSPQELGLGLQTTVDVVGEPLHPAGRAVGHAPGVQCPVPAVARPDEQGIPVAGADGQLGRAGRQAEIPQGFADQLRQYVPRELAEVFPLDDAARRYSSSARSRKSRSRTAASSLPVLSASARPSRAAVTAAASTSTAFFCCRNAKRASSLFFWPSSNRPRRCRGGTFQVGPGMHRLERPQERLELFDQRASFRLGSYVGSLLIGRSKLLSRSRVTPPSCRVR